MSGKTGIQWTDRVWNPVTGCTRVSAGCDHCYAFALHDMRHVAQRKAASKFWQENPPRHSEMLDDPRTSPEMARAHGAKLPLAPQYDLPFSRVQLFPGRLADPLKWRKPQRVFVNSMSDLFHADVPDEFIDRVFATMALCPQHTFQILTKRPERMHEYLSDFATEKRIQELLWSGPFPGYALAIEFRLPLPNVWLGVSVEDQATADLRIPLLLQTPSAVRFVSYEPALGPVDFMPWLLGGELDHCPEVDEVGDEDSCVGCPGGGESCPGVWNHLLSLIIVGGESGKGARPCDLAWLRSVRDQCRAAGICCFVKQVGRNPVCDCGYSAPLRDGHGGDWSEWPEDLRVRELPR